MPRAVFYCKLQWILHFRGSERAPKSHLYRPGWLFSPGGLIWSPFEPHFGRNPAHVNGTRLTLIYVNGSFHAFGGPETQQGHHIRGDFVQILIGALIWSVRRVM